MRKKAMLTAAAILIVLLAVFVFAACDGKVTTYSLILENGDETTTSVNDVTVVEKAPDAPVRDGYRFEGWYLDPEFKTQPTYPMVLTSDVTFYSKWTKLFNVTFQENGGSELEDLVTDVIETSPRTYRDGFVFAGWYTNPRLTGAQVKFPYSPTSNVTLYAKWTEDSGTAEYEETTKYVNATTAVENIKKYFEAMKGTAIDLDTLMTTTAGTARIQLQMNMAEGENAEMMFKVTMQEDEKVAVAVYVVNGEIYLDFGNGEAYVHLEDFKAEYLLAILQKAGAELDLEEILGNIGGIDVYSMLIGMIFSSPTYTSTTRVATGEIVRESYLAEVKVNSLVSGLSNLLDMFDIGSLIGIDLNLNSLFNWLDSAIPQVRMYVQVDCENGIITNMNVNVADNATGTEGDELLDWQSTKIGYYDYKIYIDMPADLQGNSKEFSFSNLAFDIDLTLDAPENGLDVAKLIGLFTDNVPVPENTLIIDGEFGFRLSARVDLDLNYENAAVDRNMIALDLYVLGADGNQTTETPVLGIYYRDGAFYVSLSDLIPDYWNAKNLKIEANLDALVSDIVKLITTAIDDALGTDFDEAKSLSLSSGNVYEAALAEDNGEVKAIISPTLSGLITAVVGVIGLQENVYVDEAGDSIIVEVNQKFFDVINKFMPENPIKLPEGLSNMSLSVNFAEYGVKDVVATVNLGDEANPLEAVLRAHSFRIGFLEGTLQDLESYMAERTEDGDYTSNLGELIYNVLSGVEVNARGSLNIEQGEYALGKILKSFGLDTGKDNPILALPEGYNLDIELLAGFSLDKNNPENSKLAIELKKAAGETLLAVYGYYENGVSTVLLDLSGIKTQYMQLPVYKFEFDFANIIIDLINNISINGTGINDFDLAFDLGGLIGGSSEAEALIMSESDGTAGGTELTEAGAILIGLSADKITTSVAFATIIKLLESLGVDTGISPDALDLSADIMLSRQGVTLDVAGKLPKTTKYDADGVALPEEFGNYELSLETGTEYYPISVGSTKNLDDAIARGKEKAASAEDNLYDVVFDLANSMQASLSLNLSNEKGSIDVAAIINGILAQEGSYIGFPINMEFDKSDANLYMDLKWDIHLDRPYDTKIYMDLRYENKKVLSFGVQKGDLYVDLEGVGLFEFKVINSKMAISLFAMLDEQVGALRDMDLGELLTNLIKGASGVSEGISEGGSDSNAENSATEENSTMAILSAILGDISIYGGIIQANIAASTFDTIFKALLGAPLGIDIEVDGGEIDVDGGIIRLPVSINKVFNLNAQLQLMPKEDFEVTTDSDKVLDSTDGRSMAEDLLEKLDIDFNLDIATNNVDSNGSKYLRINIKKLTQETTLDNTLSSVKIAGIGGGSPRTAPAGSILITIKYQDNDDFFTNSKAGAAFAYIVLDIFAQTPMMRLYFTANQLIATAGVEVDLAGMIPLEFEMDLIGMLSGAMQSIIDAVDFGNSGIESSDEVIEGGEEAPVEQPEESAPGILDGIDLDINELLAGGISVIFRSTGTLNVDVSFDAYTVNKLIDNLLGGVVFGVNSQIDLSQMEIPGMTFKDHYLSKVKWDRVNPVVFWNSLKTQLTPLIKDAAEGQNIEILGQNLAGIINEGMLSTLYNNLHNVIMRILPLPVYNEVYAGLQLVDGTLANIYIEGYDRNEDVVNAKGEVLEYHNGDVNIVYTMGGGRSDKYKTEINLYNMFSSVGDPGNTPDGSGQEGIVNWGDVQLELEFEPYEWSQYETDTYYEFKAAYFDNKYATYQKGDTVIRGAINFTIYNETTGAYEAITEQNLNLVAMSNNDNNETLYVKGKATVDFGSGIVREREFTIAVYPKSEIGFADPIEVHAYDKAPTVVVLNMKNRTSRIVELATAKGFVFDPIGYEGGSSEMEITFANGEKANVTVNYLNSKITTLGNSGEENVYEFDWYDFDNMLDIMSMLPGRLFFSYEDGVYGAVSVDRWELDGEALQNIANRQPGDLSGLQFKAVATIAEGKATEQTVELTIRLKNKIVDQIMIGGVADEYDINPYEYYKYLIDTAENKGTFPYYPSTVTAVYSEGDVTYSEDVNVTFSTEFDFSTMRYDAPGNYQMTVSLDESKYGGYFDWSREIILSVQSNVLNGIFFDKDMKISTIDIDPYTFNSMTAEQKAEIFRSTATVAFENGYSTQLPIRWTDRNGYPVDLNSLTFSYENSVKQMYAEIGFSDDPAVNEAFYQRIAVKVNVNGQPEFKGSSIVIDPFAEIAGQFPSTITIGTTYSVFEATVDGWDYSSVDFSLAGGEYLAIATVNIGGAQYKVLVPVTVTNKEINSFEGIGEFIGGDVYGETVEIDVAGNKVTLPANFEGQLTAVYDGGTQVVNASADFSAIAVGEDTVYYDPTSGTTSAEQGATAFETEIVYLDASGNEYSYAVTVYLTKVGYAGGAITVDPYGEAGTAQFPAEVDILTSKGIVKAQAEWNVDGVNFGAAGGEYTAVVTATYEGKNVVAEVPVTVTAKELTGFAEIGGDIYAVYDETANTITLEINGIPYEVIASATATATLTAQFADGSSVPREATFDFSAVKPDENTVYYDSSLGTTAEEQGATAFTATATVSDAAGNAFAVEIRIYVSITNRIQTEPPTEPEEPGTEPETPSDGENA